MIQNSKEAGEIVKVLLANSGNPCTEYVRKRAGRARHIELISKHNNRVHYVKYSKEPFIQFGFFFPEYRGDMGDSLDDDVVQNLAYNDTLYFAYPDKIYKVEMRDFIKPKLTRQTRGGVTTWSFPISLMDTFMEV